MNYILTMLHDGRRDCLRRTIESFEQMVTPRASAAYIHIDGDYPDPPPLYGQIEWVVERDVPAVGFCHSHGAAWDHAANSGYDWVFHLEDDFVLLRPINLYEMQAVLETEPQLTQMILYRDPVAHEIPFGGYLNQFKSHYTPRASWLSVNGDSATTQIYPWFETQRNYATNPSLMNTSIHRAHPWPREQHCEGLLGFQMRERNSNLTFGIWGDGSVWAEHIGTRQGFGY